MFLVPVPQNICLQLQESSIPVLSTKVRSAVHPRWRVRRFCRRRWWDESQSGFACKKPRNLKRWLRRQASSGFQMCGLNLRDGCDVPCITTCTTPRCAYNADTLKSINRRCRQRNQPTPDGCAHCDHPVSTLILIRRWEEREIRNRRQRKEKVRYSAAFLRDRWENNHRQIHSIIQ